MTGDHRFEETISRQPEGGINNMCEILDRIENQGIDKGIQIGTRDGIQKGEDMFALLVKKLLEYGRMDDIKRVTEDKEYRQELMKELAIVQ